MLHSFCVAIFMLHSFHVAYFSCCTLFMLYSFHVAFFSCCTVFMLHCFHVMLHCFHVALFSCCPLLKLHCFDVALFCTEKYNIFHVTLKNIENERKAENTTKKRHNTHNTLLSLHRLEWLKKEPIYFCWKRICLPRLQTF